MDPCGEKKDGFEFDLIKNSKWKGYPMKQNVQQKGKKLPTKLPLPSSVGNLRPEKIILRTLGPWLLLLLFEESQKRHTGYLHNLKSDTGNISNSMPLTTKSCYQHLILQSNQMKCKKTNIWKSFREFKNLEVSVNLFFPLKILTFSSI